MPASAKLFLALGAVLAVCGVALGAFGAHALKTRLGSEALALWGTATQYLFWHALGVMLVALACMQLPESAWLRAAGGLLAAGILLFSGSLYLLALGAPRVLGAITPIGGAAFLLGWAALAVAALRS
jgi:uncharacterized membrane protein YgdD (TMEM256/DUF423 family)